MKQFSIGLVVAAGIWLAPLSVSAQEEGCFLVDENGTRVDLGSLCGDGASPSGTPGVYSARIKRRLSGIPVVDVTLRGKNGRFTYEMMVDTGASSTVLTPQTAEDLGLVPEGIAIVSTPSDPRVPMPVGTVSSVEVGGAVARNVRVIVSPSLSTGLLGQDFFGNYDVIIKQRVVEFHRR